MADKYARARGEESCKQGIPVSNSIDLKAISPDLPRLGGKKIYNKAFGVLHEDRGCPTSQTHLSNIGGS
jgi:hypothetical protein